MKNLKISWLSMQRRPKTILWKNYPCINGFLKPHFFNIFFGIDVYFYGKLSEMLQTKLAAVFEKHIEFLFLF